MMSFKEFKAQILEFAKMAGLSVSFTYNEDKGRYEAYLSDGSLITGHASSRKKTLRRKNGFQAQFV